MTSPTISHHNTNGQHVESQNQFGVTCKNFDLSLSIGLLSDSDDNNRVHNFQRTTANLRGVHKSFSSSHNHILHLIFSSQFSDESTSSLPSQFSRNPEPV